jgi:MFS family permease
MPLSAAIIPGMSEPEDSGQVTERWRKNVIQQRISARVDHLRPQRWNWYMLVRPLDHRLERQAQRPISVPKVRSLRYFWLDGLFASVSENFFLGYIALFALAYGASNSQVGVLTAGANLLGAAALFPGARLIETVGKRKPIVIWGGGVFARFALLGLALIPFLIADPLVAIIAIIAMDGLRAFMWTSMVADLVPETMRARFFSSRNIAMGVAALVIAPLAGGMITRTNVRLDSPYAGYQLVFFLAFLFGMVSTYAFARIEEPPMAAETTRAHQRGDLRRALKTSPGFWGFIISALVWNLSLQVAAPFFNVYLVSGFQASAATVGILAGIASLFALFGQRVFSKLIDTRGAYWVQGLTGLLIPIAPLAWALITAPWQVGFINAFSGFLWAGYNLANFNLLLELTPDEQRARAVALFQLAVFGSAVAGPLLGGLLADTVGFKPIFLVSCFGRLIGTGLFLWLTVRPRQAMEMHA